MANRFSIETVFKAVDRMSAPIVNMQKRMGAFSENANKNMKALDAVANKSFAAFKTGAKIAAASAVALGVAIADIVGTGAEFDKTLVGAAAKFDPSIKRGTAGFEMLRVAAENIGESTEFNAQQGAQALKELASAGFTANQAVASLPGVVDLATAAELELGAASEIATKSLGAFGLVTEDTVQLGKNLARVTDVMAEAAGKTSASMEGLFESIKEGAPVAVSAGASMETFLAMASSMAGAGIEGSSAGTTLKNVFLAFAAPTNMAAKALKKLGVATKDSKGNMRDVIDIMADLEKSTKGMGTADKAAVLEKIFGKIPIAGVSAMLDQGTEKLRELRTQLEKSEGATKKLAATMRDTVTGDIDGFTSAIDAVKIALFSSNNEGIRYAIQGMTEWVKKSKEFIVSGVLDSIKWFKDNLEKIAYWSGKLATLAAVWMTIAAAIKVATFAWAAFQALISINPFVLVLAALALIIAFWPEISKFFSDLWTGIVEVAGKVASSVGDAVSGALDAIAGFVTSAWSAIKAPVVAVVEFVVGLVAILGYAIYKAVEFFVKPWIEMFKELYDFALPIALSIGRAFMSAFDAVYNYVASIFRGIVEVASMLTTKIAEVFAPVLEWFNENVIKSFTAGIALIGEAFANVWTVIKDTFWSILGPVIDALSGVIDSVRSVGRGVLGTESAEPSKPQVMSPAERSSYMFEEHKTNAEVTIKDQTGKATVTKAPRAPGFGITLKPSGAF